MRAADAGPVTAARRRLIGSWGINLLLRVVIVAFAVEAALAVGDPRFEGKGIAVRNLVFAGTALTLTFPLIHMVRRRPLHAYPLLADSLFLSILALDMAANSFNLYDHAWRLDLVPHTYGPMAGYYALRALGMAMVPSMVLVNVLHVLLEVQEVITDIWLETSNVRGWTDTAGDLAAGLVGSVAIPLLWARRRRAEHPPPTGTLPASA